MTPSKVWALVVAFLLVAAAIGGTFHWRTQHPDAPLLASLGTSGPPPAPAKPADLSPLSAAPPAKPAPKAPPAQEVKSPPAQEAKEEPPPPAGAPPAVAPRSAAAPAPAEAGPFFDVVRVEPKGDTVVAGKGAPNAKVQLVSGGKVLAETKADPNGQFVILPPRLSPGDYDLTLRETPEGRAPEDSKQSVAVSVPKPGKGAVVVALAEPGKATKLLSAPPEAEPGTPAPAPGKVAIRSAELENGTGFFTTGVAAPGTTIRIYLNDAHIADVTAGPDGAWSVRVLKGLTGGHYVVRADAIAADGKVLSRAEVPFDVPVAMAAAGKPPVVVQVAPKVAPAPLTPPASEQAGTAGTAVPAVPPAAPPAPKIAATAPPVAPPASSSTPQDVVVEQVATARVVAGDNLWDISRSRLGDGLRYTQIYAANAGQIRDPNLIYPGQVFVVPGR